MMIFLLGICKIQQLFICSITRIDFEVEEEKNGGGDNAKYVKQKLKKQKI